MALGIPPLNSNLTLGKTVAVWTQPWANWLTAAWQILAAAEQASTTANRPTANLWTGRPYFDTTIGKPIWWNGTIWVKADGTAA